MECSALPLWLIQAIQFGSLVGWKSLPWQLSCGKWFSDGLGGDGEVKV